MEAWTRRANAYCLALNADPNDDEARRRAAICFVRSGNEADAIAILAPTVAKSDALLNGFLVSRNRNDNTPVQRKVLFGRGGRTALARKIVLGPDAEPDVYFEHTRQDRSGAERVRDFYALASAMDGVAPRFVPRLHYCRLTNTGGYFLFDYLEVDARREGQFFDRTAELDRKLALRVVDSLVEVSSLQYPPGRAAPDGTGLRDLFAQNVEAVERHIQSEFEKHPDDAEYRRSLQSLSRGWANHQRRLNETPEIFSHGNAQRPNAIITKSGEIYLVDWETHGMAPVGIDFVALFLDRCESAEFEELGELYLRRVMPSMGAMERRAILALLAVTTSAVRGRSIPRKWLHGLESMTPRRNQRFSTVRLA